MSEARNPVSLSDVAVALDIVGMLLNQLTIPVSRSQDFAVTGAVLGELKSFVEKQISAASEPEEAPVATSQSQLDESNDSSSECE